MRRSLVPAPVASVVLGTVLVTVLAGCTASSEPDEESDRTDPGTVLALGDTATVPRSDGSAVVELTVTGVEQGRAGDLQGAELPDGAAVPVHVRYDLTLVSGNPQGLAGYDYLSAWAGDDLVAPLSTGTVPGCVEAYLPVPAAIGESVSSCRTYLAPEGATVDAVRFDNDDAYRYADGTAVTWTVPAALG